MENRKDFDFAEKSAVCAAVADYLKSGAKADGIFDRRFRSARAPEARAGANAVFKSFLKFSPDKIGRMRIVQKIPAPRPQSRIVLRVRRPHNAKEDFPGRRPMGGIYKVQILKGGIRFRQRAS